MSTINGFCHFTVCTISAPYTVQKTTAEGSFRALIDTVSSFELSETNSGVVV